MGGEDRPPAFLFRRRPDPINRPAEVLGQVEAIGHVGNPSHGQSGFRPSALGDRRGADGRGHRFGGLGYTGSSSGERKP